MQQPPVGVPSASGPLSFGYESTGVETYFRDERDPDARSRRVFSFHRPETLEAWSKKTRTLRAALRQMPPLPDTHNWTALRDLKGDALEVQYRHTLESLGKMPGMLGVIFRKAQNRVQDPAKLNRLISMIDSETWTGLDVDVKGSVYEGLLQKNAEDVKTGAGQYFTPRDLIKAIV